MDLLTRVRGRAFSIDAPPVVPPKGGTAWVGRRMDTDSDRIGLGVTHRTWDQAKDALRLHLAAMIPVHVVTLTPEMCVRASRSRPFNGIVSSAGIVVADGVGVAWGERRLIAQKIEKIPGIDLASWALEEVDRIAGRVFLLGSKPDIIVRAATEISRRYPRLKVSGYHHGYFGLDEEDRVVSAVSSTNPHLLLVGMGSPRQEMFISGHLHQLRCGVAMGVGGSFDVWSGSVGRAPAFFRKTGTEWLYRTLTQPGERLRRIPGLWRFIFLVLRKGREHPHP